MKKMILLAALCFVFLLASCGDKPGEAQDDPMKSPDVTQQEQQGDDQEDKDSSDATQSQTNDDSADKTTSDGAEGTEGGGQQSSGAAENGAGAGGDAAQEPSAEETSLDRKIIMLLREQMSGQFDTGKMEFAFDRVEVVEGAQCRVYSMMMPGNTDPDAIVYFAVLADQSVIYQYDATTKKFVQVYSIR